MTERPKDGTQKAPERTQDMDPDANRDQEPGSDVQDFGRTPGDGTLKGSTPAGTSLEEMKRLGEEGGPSEGGTG